jgi:outer membrane protein TolC
MAKRNTFNESDTPRPAGDFDLSRDEIARRAYDLYQERGAEDGRDLDDWLRAERELRERRHE